MFVVEVFSRTDKEERALRGGCTHQFRGMNGGAGVLDPLGIKPNKKTPGFADGVTMLNDTLPWTEDNIT